jgi:hypothetical protein
MTEVIESGTEQASPQTIGTAAPFERIHIVRALLLSPSEGSVLVCVGEDGKYRLPGGHYEMPEGEMEEYQRAHVIKGACKDILETKAGVTASDRSDPLPNGSYTVTREGKTIEYVESVLTATVVGTHAHGATNLVWLPVCEAGYMIRKGETIDHDGAVHRPDIDNPDSEGMALAFHDSALAALSVLAGTIREKYRLETATALEKISQAIRQSSLPHEAASNPTT